MEHTDLMGSCVQAVLAMLPIQSDSAVCDRMRWAPSADLSCIVGAATVSPDCVVKRSGAWKASSNAVAASGSCCSMSNVCHAAVCSRTFAISSQTPRCPSIISCSSRTDTQGSDGSAMVAVVVKQVSAQVPGLAADVTQDRHQERVSSAPRRELMMMI